MFSLSFVQSIKLISLVIFSSDFTLQVSAQSTDLPKILCLHGGGQSASSFEADEGMQDLESSLEGYYDFVYGQSPEDGDVWIRDPPGGKGDPTTDPNWANASVSYLDSLIASDGPFAGILGYSQGSAFATYYVAASQTAQTQPFFFAMLFCGYIPHTHTGLVNEINRTSPYHNVSALVFMGEQDLTISNSMTDEQAEKYSNPTVISSSAAGHNVPAASDSTHSEVVAFAIAQLTEINGFNANGTNV